MSDSKFIEFFKAATTPANGSTQDSGHTPYDYQVRLAGCDSGKPCESQLINIPTGLGKTAGVVIAWLWNRLTNTHTPWPGRLVYCLRMREVCQEKGYCEEWIDKRARGVMASGSPSWFRVLAQVSFAHRGRASSSSRNGEVDSENIQPVRDSFAFGVGRNWRADSAGLQIAGTTCKPSHQR